MLQVSIAWSGDSPEIWVVLGCVGEKGELPASGRLGCGRQIPTCAS